MEETAVGR